MADPDSISIQIRLCQFITFIIDLVTRLTGGSEVGSFVLVKIVETQLDARVRGRWRQPRSRHETIVMIVEIHS